MCDAKNTMTGLQAVGTLIGTKGAIDTGNATAAELQYRAAQEKAAAGQEMAAGSARIADTDLAGKMLESRMRAVAGASGVSLTSPTVIDLVGKAAGLTRLNEGMELFNAQSSANKMVDQANADIFSGQQAQKAGRTRALGTILSGASSMYNNYSGGTK